MKQFETLGSLDIIESDNSDAFGPLLSSLNHLISNHFMELHGSTSNGFHCPSVLALSVGQTVMGGLFKVWTWELIGAFWRRYLDMDISVEKSTLHNAAEQLCGQFMAAITGLRRLILIEDMVDSLKVFTILKFTCYARFLVCFVFFFGLIIC